MNVLDSEPVMRRRNLAMRHCGVFEQRFLSYHLCETVLQYSIEGPILQGFEEGKLQVMAPVLLTAPSETTQNVVRTAP